MLKIPGNFWCHSALPSEMSEKKDIKLIGKERRNDRINSFAYQSETAVKSVEEEVIKNENDFNFEQKFVNAKKELKIFLFTISTFSANLLL